MQYVTIRTAIVYGGSSSDFKNPEFCGRSGNETFQELEYDSHFKKNDDINLDGFDDCGILARSGCDLKVFYGGQEIELEHDITYGHLQKPSTDINN